MMSAKFFMLIYVVSIFFLSGCGGKKDAIQNISGASLEVFNGDSVIFLKHPSLYALVVNKSSVNSGRFELFKADLSLEHPVFESVYSGKLGVNSKTVKHKDLKFMIQGGSRSSSNVILGGIVVFENDVSSYQMALYPSTNLNKLNFADLNYTSNKHISSAPLKDWISSQMK